jgi:hypothetical protein
LPFFFVRDALHDIGQAVLSLSYFREFENIWFPQGDDVDSLPAMRHDQRRIEYLEHRIVSEFVQFLQDAPERPSLVVFLQVRNVLQENCRRLVMTDDAPHFKKHPALFPVLESVLTRQSGTGRDTRLGKWLAREARAQHIM